MKLKIFKAQTLEKIEIDINEFSKNNNIISIKVKLGNDTFTKYIGIVTYKDYVC